MLIVSREPSALDPLWSMAATNCWHLETADSGWKALERVQSATGPDLLLLDLERGDRDGLHTLQWLHRVRPDLPIVLLCYPDDAERKTEAIRLGAQDYLIKPFQPQQLESLIQRHLSSGPNGNLGMAVEHSESFGGDVFFVAASAAMRKLRAQAELLARIDDPVLIVGERGSGKRVVAQLIHNLSVRAGFRFLPLDCAALPGNVLEAELFGHTRGAAGDLTHAQPGQLELCTKGTILLNEITEMPATVQARLLHVLQEQQDFRSNGGATSEVDIRILAATSANLNQALAEKKFREDLYYRLSAFTVHVPPLRQRVEAIPTLLDHFMRQLAKHYGLPPRSFSPAVLDACRSYEWPGNLRELENFVKRYLVIGDQEVAFDELVTNRGVLTEKSGASLELLTGVESEERASGLKSLVQSAKGEAEKMAITAALEETHWNRKAAARLLQVSYRTLLYKIEQYHMNPPAYHPTFMNGHALKGNGHG
jgi:DNA-binding NtrC family response regulator